MLSHFNTGFNAMGGSSGSPGHGSAGRRGGGAGDGSGGGGRSTGSPFSCEDFEATVMLTSAKPEVLEKLSVDDRLSVSASDGKLPLVALDKKRRIAGSIVLPEQAALLKCIKGGTHYIARVTSLEGGSCIVDISAKGA